MTIHDEAQYFGTGGKHDPEILKKNFEESAIMIDKVAEMLTKAGFGKDKIETGGEMALRERKKLEGVV
jgi:predicted house-cleaning noncanonical NTP pyrophosphatase (MazG superfamily)